MGVGTSRSVAGASSPSTSLSSSAPAANLVDDLVAKIARHKASRGRQIKWIGASCMYRVSVDADRIAKLPEVVEAALAQKGLIAGMRSLAGE